MILPLVTMYLPEVSIILRYLGEEAFGIDLAS